MNWKRYVGLGVFSFLTACASLGIDAPRGFQDNIAIAQTTNTAVVQSIAAAAQQGLITKVDANNLLKQTDVAQEGIKVANDLQVTDLSAANNRLAVASAAIKAVQAYLLTKGVK